MARSSYPRQLVQRQRAGLRERAQAELLRVEASLLDQQQRQAVCAQQVEAHNAAEQSGATAATLSGTELSRVAAYARGRQLQRAALQAALARETAALDACRDALERARDALRKALADERVIERHRGQHEAEQRKLAERSAELEAEDMGRRSR